jgi:hypothetical protein
MVNTANSKKENIESMLTTMAGRLTYVSGKFTLIAGEYVSPSGTINEEDILGGITLVTRPPARELYNTVQGIYSAEPHDFVAASFKPYEDSAAVTADGGIKSPIDLQLPFTTNHKHAQLLAEITMNRSRLFKTISLSVGLIGLKYKVGDTVQLNYARAGITNDIYEIIDYEISLDEAPVVSMVLQEISDIYPTGDV